MSVTLAPATPADLEALLPLVRDYHAFEGIELADDARTNGIRGLLRADAPGRIWFILDDGQRVGYAAVCWGYSLEFGGRDGFLDELYVVPAARGRGIGSRVLPHILDGAAALGIRALHLEVARTNARARTLYAKLGFESREAFQLMTRRLADDPD